MPSRSKAEAGATFRPTLLRWSALLLLSGLGIAVFLALHLAAGLMLGPMMAAIIMAVSGQSVRVPKPLFSFAQAVIGCMVASSMSWPVLHGIAQNAPVMLFSVFSVLIVSFGTGAALAYFQNIPGTSALWGSSPGGASVMTLLSEAFGADTRLVAFMLYFRVILVAVTTSLVAHFVTGSPQPSLPAQATQASVLPTLLLIATCAVITPKLPVPAGPLLITMAVACAATLGGFLQITTPQWLRVPAYLALGWSIGMRFTGPALRHALNSLPAVTFASVLLLLTCGLLALPVAHFSHVDLLSAYLATSPGGLDAAIVISASVPVNVPFVVSLQTARMLAVIIFGPLIARPIGRWLETQGDR